MQITNEFVIVSSSDGENPGVSFFDHEWNLVKFFVFSEQDDAPYNLEVYHVPELSTLQVFVAGIDTISIIEQIKDEDGENFFKLTREVFSASKEQAFNVAQTYMAKSGDFLIIKQSNERTLGLMPLCQYKYAYETDNFSCRPCERGLKSYGLQDDQCITCMRAWLQGNSDEFKEAQYHQFCRDGYIFSLVLFIVVPSLTCLLASICCYCHRGNHKGQKALCHEFDANLS